MQCSYLTHWAISTFIVGTYLYKGGVWVFEIFPKRGVGSDVSHEEVVIDGLLNYGVILKKEGTL